MKTCPNCGMTVSDDAMFCENCGASLAVQEAQPQPQYQQAQYQPQPQYQQPQYQTQYQQPVAAAQPNCLPLAIVGFVLALSWFGSLLGIIFSAVSLGKVKRITPPYSGANKAAKVFATLGLIFGIIGTVIFTIYIIVLIAGVISGSIDSISYYSNF